MQYRSRTIIEDINSLVFEPYNLSLLILLACLRENCAEGVGLNELGKRHSTNMMSFQLAHWALAVLSCGLGSSAEVRLYIQKLLQQSDPDTALDWVRQWPLFDHLQPQLQEAMESDCYQMIREKGKALTFDSINTYLQHEFRASADVVAEASHQKVLTARESEILGLMATGMTNPQIAEQLVIGAGTVKTHTLNIYRKLDVANRTQAIVRAQEIGLLHA